MIRKLFISNRFILAIALFCALCGTNVLGQDEYDQPLPPTFDYITVNPNSGYPTLHWTAPPDHPVRPAPTGYIIYRRIIDNLGNSRKEPIDTLAKNIFSYTDTQVNAGVKPESYTIASNGDNEPSTQTSEHKTAFVTARFDTCQYRLIVDWSHYEGWGNRIEYYKVFVGTDLNADLFTQADSVLGLVDSTFIYEVDGNPIETNTTYYLYIEGKKKNVELYTKSNLTSISTNVPIPPSFMYVDSILASGKQTEIYFTIDTETEYTDFRITRWEQPDYVGSLFSARTLNSFSDPNTMFYADTTDLWTARSRKFYYKIDAYDGCDVRVDSSNLCNSMIIRAFPKESRVSLSWDSYYSPDDNDVRYKIYRTAFAPEQLEPELIYDEVNPLDTTFVDDLSIFRGRSYNPKFCYYLEAYEILSPMGKHRLSRSQPVCVEVTPDVVMPNAIDPLSQVVNDDGKPRNVFVPTISFVADYKLTIYSRWGGIVYEGVNAGWDGRLQNGQHAKEGTYIYRLEVYPPSKRTISKTGYLSVVYGPF